MCTARWVHPSQLEWKEHSHAAKAGTVSIEDAEREELAEGAIAHYRCFMDRHLCCVMAQRDVATDGLMLHGMPFQVAVIHAGQSFFVADPKYPPCHT